MDKEAAHALMRVQVAMWVDGTLGCAQCQRVFESVDDFLDRNPIAGIGWGAESGGERHFVDAACWPEYHQAHPELPDVESVPG